MQSKHNYEETRTSSFQASVKHEGHQEYLIQTETFGLKTKRHECYEDNSMQMKTCIDDVIAQELNCSLPWTIKTNLDHPDINLKYCKTAEELIAFSNLFLNSSTYLRQKLTQKGCFIPNCKHTTWAKNQFTQVWHNKKGETSVEIHIPASAKVIQRKEIRLASYATFVQDVGSYLGLYLGASILSLTDIVHVCFKRIFNK